MIDWIYTDPPETAPKPKKRRVPVPAAAVTSVLGPGDAPWTIMFPPDTHVGRWKPLSVWAIITTSQLHVASPAPPQASS